MLVFISAIIKHDKKVCCFIKLSNGFVLLYSKPPIINIIYGLLGTDGHLKIAVCYKNDMLCI